MQAVISKLTWLTEQDIILITNKVKLHVDKLYDHGNGVEAIRKEAASGLIFGKRIGFPPTMAIDVQPITDKIQYPLQVKEPKSVTTTVNQTQKPTVKIPARTEQESSISPPHTPSKIEPAHIDANKTQH
jgi:hypothetical protein